MMAKSSCSAGAMTPSLSLPRIASLAGEGTLTIGVSEIPMKLGICSLSRTAGEGWGGGLS